MYIFKILVLAMVMTILAGCAGMMPPMAAYGHNGRNAYGVAVGGSPAPQGYYQPSYRRPPPPRLRVRSTMDIGIRSMRPRYIGTQRSIDRCRPLGDGRWVRHIVDAGGRVQLEECPPPQYYFSPYNY